MPSLLKIIDTLIFPIMGAWALLLGYGVLPRNPKDPEAMERWHRKWGRFTRICGFLLLVIGLPQVLRLFL